MAPLENRAPFTLLPFCPDSSPVASGGPEIENQSEEFVVLESLFVPYFPVAEPPAPAPIVLATLGGGVPAKQSSTVRVDMTLSDCDDVQTPDNPNGPLGGEISPAGAVYLYMDAKLSRVIDVSNASVTVLIQPAHGKVVEEYIDPTFSRSFVYRPNSGFLGTDQMTFLVEVDGKRYKVIEKLYVVPVADSKGVKCFGEVKRISGIGEPEGGSTVTLSADWLRAAGFVDVAGDFSAVGLAFDNLPNGALATASMTLSGATIAIDKTAAGYGWFIDATPDDNSEFLPTSNPNEWIAKDGSGAYGKMDMLSVLMHEYGHMLGLDHSHDAHDFMATTLEPGVRRTLSADQQLELMALAGYFPVPDSPTQPFGSTDPGAPLPFTRTSTNRFARMRPSFDEGDKTEFATVRLTVAADGDGDARSLVPVD